MTYGIDIYDRYQDITSALALRDSPYDFAYVKGTDGGGPANVRPDAFVTQLRAVGLPVGLYHYAQLTPPAEFQADVLTAAVRRTGATHLPPALDLEDPHPATFASRPFAERFLLRLVRNGFRRVVLYANTSMLNGIRAWELHDVIRRAGGELLIWAANYGTNDGAYTPSDANRLLAAYPHPVWMHQYSSTVAVPGVSGRVDGNKMLHPLGEDDMEQSDKIRFWDGFEITVGQALADTWQLVNNLTDRPTRPNEPADTAPWIPKLFAELNAIRTELAATKTDVAELKARPAADVDEAALAAELDARNIGGMSSAEFLDILTRVRLGTATPGDTPA